MSLGGAINCLSVNVNTLSFFSFIEEGSTQVGRVKGSRSLAKLVNSPKEGFLDIPFLHKIYIILEISTSIRSGDILKRCLLFVSDEGERVEGERGCRLLRAPCTVTKEPTCGWVEVEVTGLGEVCSTIPVGLLSDLDFVKISTYGAVVLGVVVILYTLFTGQKPEKKTE